MKTIYLILLTAPIILVAVPRDYPQEYNYYGQPIHQNISFPEGESDRAITQAVQTALSQDPSLSGKVNEISIETINGRVVLRGHVKDDAERSRVVSIVTLQTNVKSVDNQLKVDQH